MSTWLVERAVLRARIGRLTNSGTAQGKQEEDKQVPQSGSARASALGMPWRRFKERSTAGLWALQRAQWMCRRLEESNFGISHRLRRRFNERSTF